MRTFHAAALLLVCSVAAACYDFGRYSFQQPSGDDRADAGVSVRPSQPAPNASSDPTRDSGSDEAEVLPGQDPSSAGECTPGTARCSSPNTLVECSSAGDWG